MKCRIAVIGGDGIGQEVVSSAVKVLDAVSEIFSHDFEYVKVSAGGCAIDYYGEPLPENSIRRCRECDAILLGAVGGPKWDALPGNMRPEAAILGLRKELGLYANLRPAKLFPALCDASPLKHGITEGGIDLIFVRELSGGIYYGERGLVKTEQGKAAYDTETYSEKEIERIGRVAFELAMKRRKNLVSVDKANVLESGRLWRNTMHSLSKRYSEVSYSDILVDNAAMQLVRSPSQFDVVVTGNMFGDILSDESAALTGSIGLLPSASLRNDSFGLYEPIHGSAPDIAGKGIANPIATMLSAAMMLRYSFSSETEAGLIETAVDRSLEDGIRTADIMSKGCTLVSTDVMTDSIIRHIYKESSE